MSDIRVGLKDVVAAKVLTDVSGGSTTYDTIFSIPGAVTANRKAVGAIDKFYADDKISDVNEVFVGLDMDLTIADLTPSLIATLLGHTYASGGVEKVAGDTSPYFAVGFKVKQVGGTYIYTWLYKVKFKKPDNTSETLKESTTFQPYNLTAVCIPRTSDNKLEFSMTNSDPAYDTTKWANFFTSVVTSSSDSTALTATAAVGTGGDTGKVVVTFGKASVASFSLVSTTVTASTLLIVGISGNIAGTYAVGSAGTSVTVKFTPTTPFGSGDDIGVTWTSGIKDNSGVSATPNGDVLTF